MATKKPMPAKRADFGLPIDGFIAKQPPPLRAIIDKLRPMIEKAAPDAQSSLKWGQAFFTIDGAMYAALGAHKAHVNLILAGSGFDDPKGLLAGASQMGNHQKLTSVADVDVASARRWLKTAAANARAKGKSQKAAVGSKPKSGTKSRAKRRTR